jgi:hypothetical protein
MTKMKLYFLKPLILLALLLPNFAVYSQNSLPKYMLTGRVLDNDTNEPLTGSTIVLEGTEFYGISGLDGTFSIRNIPIGEYQIVLSYISYETHREKITINQDLRKEVRLKPSLYDINEIQIIGIRNLSTEASARTSERLAINSINATNSIPFH